MTLEEKQNHMIQEINALGDCFDQYSYLIIKGQQLPHMPEARKLTRHWSAAANRRCGCMFGKSISACALM